MSDHSARAKDKGLGGIGTGVSGGQFAERTQNAPGPSASLGYVPKPGPEAAAFAMDAEMGLGEMWPIQKTHGPGASSTDPEVRGEPGSRLRVWAKETKLPDGVRVENYAFEQITTNDGFAMSYGGVCDPGRVRWAPAAGNEKDEHGLDPRNIHFSGGPMLNYARACEISGFARTHQEGWDRLHMIEAAWALRYDRRPNSSLATFLAEKRGVSSTRVTLAEMDEEASYRIEDALLTANTHCDNARWQLDAAAEEYKQHRFAFTREAKAAKRDALARLNQARHALESAQTERFIATDLFGPLEDISGTEGDDPHGYYSSMGL